MKKRGIVSACLCVAVIISSTGCNLSKLTAKEKNKLTDDDIEQIGELMEGYVDALRNWEYEPLYDLTTLDLDGNYSWLKNSINMQREAAPGTQEEATFEYCKYIASTIEADYDLDDVEIDNGKAYLEVEFSTVYWAEVGWQTYKDAGSMVADLKRTNKRETVSDEITFKQVDGEWKISRVQSLFDLVLFYCNYPTLDDTSYIEPVPTIEETTMITVEPVTAEEFNRAMDYNHYELVVSNEGIDAFADKFFKENCGEYDFDGNGATELIYFGYHDEYGTYGQITVYDPESDGVYFCSFSIPDECIDPDGDGALVMYSTGNEFVVSYYYGDNDSYKYETYVYNKILFPLAYYRREVDLSTGTQKYYTDYVNVGDNDSISASQYEAEVSAYAGRAETILYNKDFTQGVQIEYPNTSVTYDEWRTREEMVDYYESILE